MRIRNIILSMYLLASVIGCQTNKIDELKKNLKSINCKSELETSIEIWHYTGSQNLIGNFYEKIENKYVKNLNGWDNDNYPYPKKFDVKVILQNNLLAYEQEAPNKIESSILNIILKLRVGQSPNALYPLNSSVYENIEIAKDKLITNEDFISQEPELTIWKKSIPFEELYKKYEKQGLFINQFIFEINITDKGKKNTCNYEYIFPMAERGE